MWPWGQMSVYTVFYCCYISLCLSLMGAIALMEPEPREWSMILPYAGLATEACCVIPDLLNCPSVQCWWVMVLPYLPLVSDLKYVVLKLHFSARDGPTISPWNASWDFTISGAGRHEGFNLHSIGKAPCRNWNFLGEYRKCLDSASLWIVKSMMLPGLWRLIPVLHLHCSWFVVCDRTKMGTSCTFMLFF